MVDRAVGEALADGGGEDLRRIPEVEVLPAVDPDQREGIARGVGGEPGPGLVREPVAEARADG